MNKKITVIRNQLSYIEVALEEGQGLYCISEHIGVDTMSLYAELTELGMLNRLNLPDSFVQFYMLQCMNTRRRDFLKTGKVSKDEFTKLVNLVKAPKTGVEQVRRKYVLEHYRHMSVRSIANNLLIHGNTVLEILRTNGVDVYGGKWSDRELEFLSENYRIMELSDLAAELGREVYQVRNTIEKRYKLVRRWSRKELEHVRAVYYVYGAAPLALEYGVSVNCITQAFHKLHGSA